MAVPEEVKPFKIISIREIENGYVVTWPEPMNGSWHHRELFFAELEKALGIIRAALE